MKMENLQIRDATSNDRDAIQAVTLAAYEQYAAVMGDMWNMYLENIVNTLADVKPAEQIVAETDAGVVGTALLFPAGSRLGDSFILALPEIRLVAVDPAARGQGVGQALMRECIQRARQSGAAAITLHTTDMMSVAQGMYVRMGFIRAPELDFSPAPEYLVKGYRFDLNNSEKE